MTGDLEKMKKFDELKNIKTTKIGIMDNISKSGFRKGKSLIDFLPHGRYVIVEDDLKKNETKKKLIANGFIDPNSLSDKERQKLGIISKGADVANKDAEEQEMFKVVGIGPEVMYVAIGDSIMLRPAGQYQYIVIKDKYYLIFLEHEVYGTYLNL